MFFDVLRFVGVVEGTGDLRSTVEAAEWLGITVRTLQRLTESGEISFRVVGRNHRYSAEDLDAYLEAHRVHPGSLAHLVSERTGDVVLREARPRVPPPPREPMVRTRREPRVRVPREAKPRKQSQKAGDARERARREAAKLEAARRAAEAAADAEARQRAVVAHYIGGASVERLARHLRIGVRTAYTDLARAGVSLRGQQVGDRRASYAGVFTREYLMEEYINKQRSVPELAREASCSQTTVLNWLRRREIEIRPR